MLRVREQRLRLVGEWQKVSARIGNIALSPDGHELVVFAWNRLQRFRLTNRQLAYAHEVELPQWVTQSSGRFVSAHVMVLSLSGASAEQSGLYRLTLGAAGGPLAEQDLLFYGLQRRIAGFDFYGGASRAVIIDKEQGYLHLVELGADQRAHLVQEKISLFETSAERQWNAFQYVCVAVAADQSFLLISQEKQLFRVQLQPLTGYEIHGSYYLVLLLFVSLIYTAFYFMNKYRKHSIDREMDKLYQLK